MIHANRAITALCATLACVAYVGIAAAAETTLYGFQCTPDGSEPLAGLVPAKSGNLLGTTFAGGLSQGGTIFDLAPPASGETNWTESVLYSFDSQTEQPPVTDAVHPMGGLVLGQAGVFYGTGYHSADFGCDDSGCGAVYALTPKRQHMVTTYHESVVYDFLGMPDGQNPIGNLVVDSTGALYGVTTYGGTAGAGTVFELTPPAAAGQPWTNTTLYNFQNGTDGGFPAAGLLFGTGGVLYGTTADSGSGTGTVFKLTPPTKSGHPWTETVLYTFGISGAPDDGAQPMATLVANKNGALFGTTLFGGTDGLGAVFRLLPPKAGKNHWNYATLYSFTNSGDGALPGAALLLKANAMYGTTEGTGGTGSYGTVFEIAPPTGGSTTWTETTLYQFTGGADGKYPFSTLIADSAGNLYGTTEVGGPQKCGVAFEVTP